MPKETVHSGTFWAKSPESDTWEETGFRTPDELEGMEVRQDPSLSVHWDGHSNSVQVSITFSREQWKDCLEELEASPELKRYGIYTCAMSRNDINDMIRALRRARDAAHGKDE